MERQWLIRNPVMMVIVGVVIIALGNAALQVRDMSLAFPAFLVLILATANLHTRLEGGLVVSFWPFWRTHVPAHEILGARIEDYRVTRFGGWGIRFGRGALAYTVRGRQAIRLRRETRDLLIGTQDPDAWIEALRMAGIPIDGSAAATQVAGDAPVQR